MAERLVRASLLSLLLVPVFRALLDARLAARRLAALVGAEDGSATFAAAAQAVATRMDRLSHRDSPVHPVTGLPTREGLATVVQAHAAAGGGPRLLAVLRFADFDRIASFDQDLAKTALKALAERIGRASRQGNFVAQVDRDCFAAWLAEPDHEAALAELRALAHLLAQELPSATTTLSPAIEIGFACYPADGRDTGSLLTRAITARTRPQQGCDGSFVLVDPVPLEKARETFILEQDLAQAIAEEQLTMLFQPLVDVRARRVVGAEALLRWQHPTLGQVSPARFIPIVEALGLSDQFGSWVLNAACREARRWRDAKVAGVRVAVNLSACQLADPMLQQKIDRTLSRHHLPPQCLELELTETAAMADAGRTLRIFSELHDLGIALALDDFGSGHSSLSYLKNLPFDKLKIDREFVTSVHAQKDSLAICRALIELGRGLDLRILAEGVECREEAECLIALGCTLFQGYFFSRPLSGADFLAFALDPSRIPMFPAADSFVHERRVPA